MSGLKRTSPGYCVRCGKTHKTEKAALKCLARHMKDRSKEAKSESVRVLVAQLDEARKRTTKPKVPKAAPKKSPLEGALLAHFNEEEADDIAMEIHDAIGDATHNIWDIVFKSKGTIKWGMESEHQDSTLGDPHYWGQVRFPSTMTVTKKVSHNWFPAFQKALRHPNTKKAVALPAVKAAIESIIQSAVESTLDNKPGNYDADVLKLGDRVQDIAWDKGKIETDGTVYDEEGEEEGGFSPEVKFDSWLGNVEVSKVAVSAHAVSFEVTISYSLRVFRLIFPDDYEYHRH